MTSGKSGQGGDVIDDAMREVGCATHEKNGARIDEAADGGNVNFV